jgi:hypothetical protein
MRRLLVLSLAALMLAACSGASGGSAPLTDAPTADLLPAATEAAIPTNTAAPAIAETQDSGAPAITEAATIAPTATRDVGQRSAPVGVDAGFHNDAPTVFAATGNPQLIEFFTFW